MNEFLTWGSRRALNDAGGELIAVQCRCVASVTFFALITFRSLKATSFK